MLAAVCDYERTGEKMKRSVSAALGTSDSVDSKKRLKLRKSKSASAALGINPDKKQNSDNEESSGQLT